MAIIASETTEQKAGVRDTLLPRLDQSSSLLSDVAAGCFSRSFSLSLVVDSDFIRLFRLLKNEDARVREPIIVELRNHIQGSEETARRSLVDAGILRVILPAHRNQNNDDLVSFMITCLPILGPSFTQSNGGSTLFPLLTNEDSRIRTAAIQALKNAVDSCYGNMENMAKAGIVETLHPLTATDEAIRDLWCRTLPKVAPLLTNRTEVDILFEDLKNTRQNMRDAAFDALTIMAKTSEITRRHLFPALLDNLENPSPEALPLIAKALSLSGSAFVSSNNELELLYYILNGDSDIVVAAIEATTQLLEEGSRFERKKLFDANVFTVALKLHDRRSQREQSLKLLYAIVSNLSYEILHDENLAIEMLSLFDDPDPRLSTALYQAWSSDPRVYQSTVLPELFPLLFDEVHNPSVVSLLREVVPHIVPQLVLRKRVDIIVRTLTEVTDINVIQVFLQATCDRIENSNENEKDLFVAEPLFVSIIGKHLKGSDETARHYASTIIDLLSKGSQPRSGRIMNEGIGRDLSWIALNGEKRAQQSSLDALYSLFMTAPDRSDRLVSDSLPNLRDILRQEGQAVDVYEKTLYLLLEIFRQSSHSVIIKSNIVVDLVRWLSPQHSTTDEECRNCVFDICQLIAQESYDGRQALVDADILPQLSHLASSQKAIEVVYACKILKALAHTGTCRNAIISAGLNKVMENITSPLQRWTLRSMEETRLAQSYAKEVLETLKRYERYDRLANAQSVTAPQRSLSENALPEAEPRLSCQSERNVSDVVTFPVSGTPAFKGFQSKRSLSESDQHAFSQPRGACLSSVNENGVTTIEEENLSSSTVRPHQMNPRRRTQDDDNFTFATAAEENINLQERTLSVAQSTTQEFEAAGASNSTTSGNMFSSNSLFMGGAYYHVRGDARFSTMFQVSSGFETLYRNISASAFHDSRERFPPPRCHPSTRKDILAKILGHITETPSSSKILHLFGSEGTGKSAIAQTIAEYCQTNGTLGACFFFSRVSLERNTDKNLIATLAYQLCVTVPELKPFISKAVEDDLSTFQKDVDTQMERLIINPIIQATNEAETLRYPIVIIIDGLDECEGEKEQCAFLRAISGAIGRYSLPLYFFITSRQEEHIVDCLDEDPTFLSTLDLDQNHVRTKEDIEAYICSEFERIRSVHHIPESFAWPSQANIQMVILKTNMLFSRASEIMAFIDQKNALSPETQLEFILRTSAFGVKSSRPTEVLSGLQAAGSAAPNLNHDKPKSRPNREKNDGIVISGRVEVDGLRYRRRPNINSDAIGQYPIGAKISITGFTQEGTTVVKRDPRWARLSNGYWVALANGEYVSWTGSIPQC